MQQHSKNAAYLAERMQEEGLKITYPGLPDHPDHKLMEKIMNPGYGFGGLLAIDMLTADNANKLMVAMQDSGLGYLAVSLGYYKTLFSNSSNSTSSEVPEEFQSRMGLSQGLVRMSVGLDHNIEATWKVIKQIIKDIF